MNTDYHELTYNPRPLRGEVILDNGTKRRYRVLYLPTDGDAGYWIDIDSKSNIPESFSLSDLSIQIGTGRCTAVMDPCAAGIAGENTMSEASIRIRDRSYDMIRNIINREPEIYERKARAELMKEAEKSAGISRNNLYTYLGMYWRNGMTKDALLPNLKNRGTGRPNEYVASNRLGRRGRKGENGKILQKEDYDKFRKAIEKFYKKDSTTSLKRAYDKMIAEMYTKPHFKGDTAPEQLPPEEKPSYTQFHYWHRKNQDIVEEQKAREGNRYNLKHRGITGKAETFIKGPGMAAQIDATIADYYLVRENNRDELVGRPVMFFIKDVCSRMITGMYVTLENSSWNCAMMALKNAAEDKVAFCRRYGIEITPEDWPCRSLPSSITADNGEMGDKGVESVIAALGITVENTPPYRGDLKAIIEKTFDMINLSLDDIVPGHVEKDAGQRGSVDRRKEACIDLKTFTAMIIRCVLYYNNYWYMNDYQKTPEMREHHIRPIPREIWNYGMQYETGALKVISEDEIRRALLPREKASVTEKGILFRELYYTCEKAQKEAWFDKARIKGRWKVPIAYDPTCLDHIHIISEDETIECVLLSKSRIYSGKSEEEMKDYAEEDKNEKAAYAQTLEAAKTNLYLNVKNEVERCQGEKKNGQIKSDGSPEQEFHKETKSGRDRPSVRKNRSKESSDSIRQSDCKVHQR